VKAGIVTGEVTEMKVTEAGRERLPTVSSPREAHGDAQAEEYVRESDRPACRGQDPVYRCPGAAHQTRGVTDRTGRQVRPYGSERLDPGQDATQSLDVEFPAEALRAKKLKEIRLELAYIPVTVPGGEYNSPCR